MKDERQWTQVWSVAVTDPCPNLCRACVCDLEGDGRLQIVTPTAPVGYTIFSDLGEKLRFVSTGRAAGGVVVGRDRGEPVLVPYGAWEEEIQGYDRDGAMLWSFTEGEAVNDICPVDFPNGDVGFAIGYNGDGGVSLLTAQGERLWNTKECGNVWSVASMRGKEGVQILAVEADDGFAIYNLDGKLLRIVEDEDEDIAFFVAAGDLNEDGIDEVLSLGPTLERMLKLRAMTWLGQKLWQAIGEVAKPSEKNGKPMVVGRFLESGRQVVLSQTTGLCWFDANGLALGELRLEGVGGVAALPQKSGPDLLLVRSAGALSAYRLGKDVA